MLTKLFFPDARGVRVDRVWREGEAIHLAARTTRRKAHCPLCRRYSRRVRSHYRRTITDLPCGGAVVTVHLQTRRFVCRVRGCRRKIFTERIPTLVAPSARRTARAHAHLQRAGFDLGGEAGARHATAEGVPVSARTVLRLVRAAPLPEASPVRVVGVDDWARRKGRAYGTILVNLETHEVVDLLPDRTAETLAAWLRAHPGVEIISRDRAGAYAEGARQGAPTATQVADRFHILQNLGDMVEGVVRRHPGAVRAADKAGDPTAGDPEPCVAAPAPVPPTPPPATHVPTPTRPLTRVEQERQERRAWRQARYEEVMALHRQGASQRDIARALRIGRHAVRRLIQAGAFPERARPAPRTTILRPYDAYHRARWDAGYQNADQLWREIRARGFTGSARTVRHHLARWRAHPGTPGRKGTAPVPAPTPAPPVPRAASPRQAAGLLLRAADDLDAHDRAYLGRLVHLCPEIGRVHTLAQEFQEIVRTRNQAGLEPWLQEAECSGSPEVEGFAQGLRRDRAAVAAALTLEWSQGQTEGQVHRLKVLKRGMYGRASFDLLRQRVLHAA